MPDVQFHGRFRKRKIGREKLALLRLRHFLGKDGEQAQQRAKIDLLAQHDSFDLKEVRGMRGINLVIAKTAGHGKIFAGDQWIRRQGASRHGRALAAQNQATGPFLVIAVPPSAGTGGPAGLMGGGHLREKRFGDRLCVGRGFHEVDVVNGPRRMELRHIQGIHVPEFGFDQRASHLLKAHADQFMFDQVQKFPVRMPPSRRDPRGS